MHDQPLTFVYPFNLIPFFDLTCLIIIDLYLFELRFVGDLGEWKITAKLGNPFWIAPANEKCTT